MNRHTRTHLLRGKKSIGGAALCLALMFLLTAAIPAQAKRTIEFSRHEFSMELPQRWVKVPRGVFMDKMSELKKAYEGKEAKEHINYDYAIQLRSKEWFEYPYMLISVWEDTRVDREEMSQMNERVKESLLQESQGVSGTTLVHSDFDRKRHLYRVESRFQMGDRRMALLKAVRYMNSAVLEIGTYMPEEMYSEYAPDVQEAVDNLRLSSGNIHRENPAKGLDFKEDILPYLKTGIATFLVLLLVGIFFWRTRRSSNGE